MTYHSSQRLRRPQKRFTHILPCLTHQVNSLSLVCTYVRTDYVYGVGCRALSPGKILSSSASTNCTYGHGCIITFSTYQYIWHTFLDQQSIRTLTIEDPKPRHQPPRPPRMSRLHRKLTPTSDCIAPFSATLHRMAQCRCPCCRFIRLTQRAGSCRAVCRLANCFDTAFPIARACM
jgi:hypothetical protein